MAQNSRPASDVSVGAFSANGGVAPLCNLLNETSFNDSNGIASSNAGADTTYRCTMSSVSAPDPSSPNGTLSIRLKRSSGSGGYADVKVYSAGSLVQSFTTNGTITASFQTFTFTVSNAISSYSTLELEVIKINNGFSPVIECSWIQLQFADPLQQVNATGVGSSFAAGVATVKQDQKVSATGLGSSFAVGIATAKQDQKVNATGIGSSFIAGVATAVQAATATGVGSGFIPGSVSGITYKDPKFARTDIIVGLSATPSIGPFIKKILDDDEALRFYALELDYSEDDTKTLFYADNAFTSEPPLNNYYDERLLSSFTFNYSIWNNDQIGGLFIPSRGEIKLSNGLDLDGGTLDHLRTHNFSSVPFRILMLGILSDGYLSLRSEAPIVSSGVLEGISSFGDDIVSFSGRDDQYMLAATDFQQRLYQGYCVSFPSSSASIDFGNSHNFTGNFSVEFWIYPLSVTTAQVIVSNDSGTGGYSVSIQPNGILQFLTRGMSSTTTSTPSGYLQALRWQRVTCNMNATGGIRTIYIDKVQAAQTTGLTGTPASSASHCILGGTTFTGRIDSLNFWSASKTLAEVKFNTFVPLSGKESNLSGCYLFNENGGLVAKDSSPNGRDGAISTAVVWADADWVPSSLRGKAIPLCIGEPPEIAPVAVDPVEGIYQWNDGEVQGVTTVWGNGRPLTLGTNYTVDNNRGVIQLLTSVTGKVTLKGQGLKWNGTYINKIGDIVNYILQVRASVPTTSINLSSIATVNANLTGPVGLYITEQKKINVVLSDFLQAPLIYLLPDRSGVFQLAQFAEPKVDADVALYEEDIVSNLKPLQQKPVIWRVIVAYAHNYGFFDPNDLEDYRTTDPARYDFATNEWRYAQVSDKDVLAAHPDARTVTLYTNYVNESDAIACGNNTLGLFKIPRDMFQASYTVKPLSMFVGQTVNYTASRLDLQSGENFVILESQESGYLDNVTLTLWGRPKA
jgi:hypothetical protein